MRLKEAGLRLRREGVEVNPEKSTAYEGVAQQPRFTAGYSA